MSKLQIDFINYFSLQETISTKEIYLWYSLNKSNVGRSPYRSEIHQLIINPLLHKGILSKLTKGLYSITQPSLFRLDDLDIKKKDEWDEYVEDRLKERR